MNYAFAFPIPQTLTEDWLALRVTDTEVAMSPLAGTGTTLFVQWFEGWAGYRWLLRLGSSFRATHGIMSVAFKPWAPEVRKAAVKLGAQHISTDAEKEERWLLHGPGVDRWLKTGKPLPEFKLLAI